MKNLNADSVLEVALCRKRDKKFCSNNAKIFVDKILSGKIDNIKDAEKEYLKKNKGDKEYLDNKSTSSVNAEELKGILSDLEYAVFRIDTPEKNIDADTELAKN